MPKVFELERVLAQKMLPNW